MFNISDKMFVSVDILLELREVFKTESANFLVIQAKLESLSDAESHLFHHCYFF